ncbi:sigma-54-dependent Fis family transcriptional regulator [Clostridium chrysemydis]|uniref:sigma-54-dependent Fis family transcriptional regulator n=1 Tax=Clostridium chrysemydis TaxID=2665504 RepID=UPI003F2D89C3
MLSLKLKDIYESVNEYAKLLANILQIDIEIVDSDLFRVSGTGIYKDKVFESIHTEGFIYREVLRSRKALVVENPGENELCKDCKHYKNCEEYMEIAVPIKYSSEIFGVIGLVCSNPLQREILSKNLDTNLKFLEQIAEFIAIKLIESKRVLEIKDSVEFLKQIIDSIDTGVITLDEEKKISLINNFGMKILKVSPKVIGGSITLEDTGDYYPGRTIYNIDISGKKTRIVGKVIKNFLRNKECDKVLVFREDNTVQKEVVNITHGKNTIGCNEIIGNSLVMTKLKSKIKKIAHSKSTVLIIGESGTGKELVARAIHSEGDRKDKPFIAINCGAIPEELLESELFGYVKGAFSGASTNGRVGKFELANNGVIFLDEIGDMPLYLQVKLLRVLQERTIVRVGSNKLIKLNIRIIAATNRNLKDLVSEGKFREDLYYRLNVIPIELPPLRDRGGDIEIIAYELVKKYSKIFNKYVHTIDDDVLKKLNEFPWKGNVRELENAIEFMVNLCLDDGIIKFDMLPKSIVEYKKENEAIEILENKEIKTLKELEEDYINKVLDIYGRDTIGKKIAAKKLGIGIATLYRKIEK